MRDNAHFFFKKKNKKKFHARRDARTDRTEGVTREKQDDDDESVFFSSVASLFCEDTHRREPESREAVMMIKSSHSPPRLLVYHRGRLAQRRQRVNSIQPSRRRARNDDDFYTKIGVREYRWKTKTRTKANRDSYPFDDSNAKKEYYYDKNNENNKPPMQQKVLTKFLELPTVPIGQYVASPTSYLHKLDSRLKQAWLVALLLCPSMANEPMERVCVCLFLVLASATSLPRKVWGSHTRNLGVLALALFVFAAIGSDGVPLLTQPREPAAALEGLENVEGIALLTSYKYAILNFGPIHVTRRGVTIATNAACVTFTALQSAHMALCTTTPESLAFSMRWYLTPLKKVFKVETDEIVFTLLLALRFTSIVFEETRNLSLGLASRGLDWKNLGFRGSIDVFMQLLARLMDSLFANAKAISEAAESRGYNSDSDDDDDVNDFFDNERGYGTQDNSKSYLRIENYVGTFLLCAFVLHFCSDVCVLI